LKTTRKEFDTYAELYAFMEGVAFVNDDSVTVRQDADTPTPTAIITDEDADDVEVTLPEQN
jgi:hypothetical protein